MLCIQVWSELSQIRDREGNYDGAVQAMEQAKTMQRQLPHAQQMVRHSAALNDLFAKLYSELDEATLKRWASVELASPQQPSGIAHLIGFPRSGTTLLEQVLDAHPKILSAPERAVFSKSIFPAMCLAGGRQVISADVLNSLSVERLSRQRDRYLRCHRAIHGQAWDGRIHLDKNPNHMSLVAGLFRLFPESRFIVALRDPRDVVVSAYLRYLPLSEFSAAFLSWENTCAMYVHEMKIWLRMRQLLPDHWLEVAYEDVVKDFEPQVRSVVRFLDLDWDTSVANYRQRTSQRLINSPSHAEARLPIYAHAAGRWRNYEKYLQPLVDALAPFIEAFGYDRGLP